MIAIVLFSYRRPELTAAAIRRSLVWKENFRLYVSIDGIRPKAGDVEIQDRQRTIKVAEECATLDSRVEVVVWDQNLGLTDHAIRMMKGVFNRHTQIISLEEDNEIGAEGLNFLKLHSVGSSPSIAAAYSRYSHPNAPFVRKTFFPNQWGTALNESFFGEVLRTVQHNEINQSVVERSIIPEISTNRKRREFISKYWSELFRSSITDPSHGDAIFQYTAMRLGLPYSVPTKTLLQDLGHLDSRGMHPRERALPQDLMHVFRPDGSTQFCVSCEQDSCRLPLSRFTRRTYEQLYWRARRPKSNDEG